jgi:hypothetical protein
MFLICGVGILAFLFLVILPAQRVSAELDQEIGKLSSRIDEQKILSPVFKNLFAKTAAPAPSDPPAPPRVRLARAEIAGIPKRLQEMAAAHRLSTKEVALDINTATDASSRLLVRFSAHGHFPDLRGFLIELGALPSLEGVEEINVKAVEGGQDIGLRIWMARE